MTPDMKAFADQLWLARLDGGVCEPPPDLSLDQAYTVAAHNHLRRLRTQDGAVGRKIGHTNPANWPAQGLRAPTWGWLYGRSTHVLAPVLPMERWQEPKVELELVFRLGDDHRPDAMALGLEVVDRPYPHWQFSVPASVAAGGVHAALYIGPWRRFDPDEAGDLSHLRARLQVGSAVSEGGSALVLGSPLRALAALSEVLDDQEALPLQPDEIITTGALAPALPLRLGLCAQAHIEGLKLPAVRFEFHERSTR